MLNGFILAKKTNKANTITAFAPVLFYPDNFLTAATFCVIIVIMETITLTVLVASGRPAAI